VSDRNRGQGLDRRIAGLALQRFRRGGFAGTSIADLAGILGVSKAAVYYHYRSKDALLHRLVDPLLDAIDACIDEHSTPTSAGPVGSPAARELLGEYLAVLIAHREVMGLVATDVAVLNHPTIGPRIRAQDQQLRTLLTAPEASPAATLRAEAALGAIRRPVTTETTVDLTGASQQQILVDVAVGILQGGHGGRSSPRQKPPGAVAATGTDSRGAHIEYP
jgi:AcrR family transcriptional regulator